jgi:hypothetical protein
VPRWFGVDLAPPETTATDKMNNMLAFFHYISGDCVILPATAVVDHRKCSIDVDRSLYYLKMSCGTVEEAKKRALVLAYLTYDLTRHIFVKLNTSSMLANPYDHQNIYEV